MVVCLCLMACHSKPENVSQTDVLPEIYPDYVEVTIPVGVTSIGGEAFARCRWLKDVALPVGVTTIGEYAFFCCSGLKSVTIPSSVTIIGRYAFRDCLGLTVTMENGVTSIRPTALTVRVSAGDAERVRKLLADAGADTSKLLLKEIQ